MTDRQPTKPGRVAITDEVTKETRFATIQMADEPTDDGTPPIKVNLLTDKTSAKYPPEIETVNDALYCLSQSVLLRRVKSNLPALPTGQYWSNIVYGKGIYLATSTSAIAAYSKDGCVTWTKITLPAGTGNVSSVLPCYGSGKFVVLFNYGSGISDKYAYSTDCVNWAVGTLPYGNHWYDIKYADSKFFACGTPQNVAIYSSDAVTWSSTTLPSGVLATSCTYGNGKWMVVSGNNGVNSKVAYSSDLQTWQSKALPKSFIWGFSAYGNGQFAVLPSQGGSIMYSADLQTWNSMLVPQHNNYIGMYNFGGKFLGATNDHATVYIDPGVGCTEYDAPNLSDVLHDGSKFVSLGTGGQIYFSAQGTSWADGAGHLEYPSGEDVLPDIAESLGLSEYLMMQTGTYVGTGTYGVDSPNSIVCGFRPKVLLIASWDDDTVGVTVMLPTSGDAAYYSRHSSNTAYYGKCEVVENGLNNSVKWWSTGNMPAIGSPGSANSYGQLNEQGKQYYYVAIGQEG